MHTVAEVEGKEETVLEDTPGAAAGTDGNGQDTPGAEAETDGNGN